MIPLPLISEQRLLAVYAHPDDECYCSGGTLAKYSDLGAETMVISATKGQAGQINDTHRATRRTLGTMREKELRASCQALDVHHVECWDYLDGALAQADETQLIGDIAHAIRRFRPHIVVTFGPDGAYGHPDHIAIGAATMTAFQKAGDKTAYPEQLSDNVETHHPQRLYFAHFPERRTLLLEQLAQWLLSRKEHFQGTLDFVHGLQLFAEESTMLHYSNDFVDVRWFPPGFCIVEQDENSSDLYVILSGKVAVQRESNDGTIEHLAMLEMGEFFGEVGAAQHHTRTAHVIAKEPVTCLVFSPGEPSKFAGRGEGAMFSSAYTTADELPENTGIATHVIDVQAYIYQKISAISQHRTQYPMTPDMLPEDMLKTLFGKEYFIQVYPRIELATEL